MPCLATTAAAAWINKVLEETELEWLLWVDLDTVIIDASFVFPFKRFRDADLVVYGDEDGTRAGDPAEGQAVGWRRVHSWAACCVCEGWWACQSCCVKRLPAALSRAQHCHSCPGALES